MGGGIIGEFKESNICELSFNLKKSCTDNTELPYALLLAFPSGNRVPSPGTVLITMRWQRRQLSSPADLSPCPSRDPGQDATGIGWFICLLSSTPRQLLSLPAS